MSASDEDPPLDPPSGRGNRRAFVFSVVSIIVATVAVTYGTIVNTTRQRRAFRVQVIFHQHDGTTVAEAWTTTKLIMPYTPAAYSVSVDYSGAPADTTCDLSRVDDV